MVLVDLILPAISLDRWLPECGHAGLGVVGLVHGCHALPSTAGQINDELRHVEARNRALDLGLDVEDSRKGRSEVLHLRHHITLIYIILDVPLAAALLLSGGR